MSGPGGTFRADEKALDGYWITDASVETEALYTGERADVNMRALSCTLERVQMLNILYKPELFEGKTFSAYGRVAGIGLLLDPYYDGSWQIPFRSGAESPAIGTLITLKGRVSGGALTDCTLETLP